MKGVPVTDHFVQRDAETEQLDTFFQPKSESIRQKVFVVYGLGGIGKTQLCVECAQAVSRQCGGKAAERSGIFESATIQNAEDLDAQVDILQRWLSLEANTSWLLVLDNVDREWQAAPEDLDPQAFNVKDFLSSADHGNVLITTGVARLQRPGASLHPREVNNDLGREMLEARAGRKLPGLDVDLVFGAGISSATSITGLKAMQESAVLLPLIVDGTDGTGVRVHSVIFHQLAVPDADDEAQMSKGRLQPRDLDLRSWLAIDPLVLVAAQQSLQH
ncbi:hypothetical protein LTR27_012174 [Elasticomyces elasticus]|nr:hypothetical protein LTR27_012174 [Elasticomyces elasticus]